MHSVPGVRDGDLLTTSRELFERGSHEVVDALHFATYGVPAFEALIDTVLRHERSEVTVLAQPVAGTSAQVVALAVRHNGGAKAVHSSADVDSAAHAGGAEENADGINAELKAYAQQLARTVRIAEETENQSGRIGKAHQALALAAAASLLEESGVDTDLQYMAAVNLLLENYADREQLYVSKLPLGLLQHQVLIVGQLAPSPTDSNFCRWTMPQAQLSLLLGAAEREGRSLKKRGGQIPVEQLLRRLNERNRLALRELQ